MSSVDEIYEQWYGILCFRSVDVVDFLYLEGNTGRTCFLQVIHSSWFTNLFRYRCFIRVFVKNCPDDKPGRN